MGYLNSVLSSSSQVHSDDGPVSGGGLRFTFLLLPSLNYCYRIKNVTRNYRFVWNSHLSLRWIEEFLTFSNASSWLISSANFGVILIFAGVS